MKSPFLDESFVARWAAGELSEAELRKLNESLAQDPEAKLFFDEIGSIWKASSLLKHENYAGEKDESWLEISRRTVSKTGKKHHHLPAAWYWAAAASILVMFLIYRWTDREIIVEVRTGRNERMEVRLPDSSKVNLNSFSALRYDRNHFIKERVVILEGEGFFEVVRQGGTFAVEAAAATIEVLGTSFNVGTRENRVRVACRTGVVGVSADSDPSRSLVLKAGWATESTVGGAFAVPARLDTLNIGNWTRDDVQYKNVSLKDVLEDMHYRFGIDFELPKANTMTFSGSLPEDLNVSLRILRESTGLIFDWITDSSIVVR